MSLPVRKNRQARRDKIILFNPSDIVANIKSTDMERDFLTFEEVKRPAETPCKNTKVKRAFLFCCYTGLRLSDVESQT